MDASSERSAHVGDGIEDWLRITVLSDGLQHLRDVDVHLDILDGCQDCREVHVELEVSDGLQINPVRLNGPHHCCKVYVHLHLRKIDPVGIDGCQNTREVDLGLLAMNGCQDRCEVDVELLLADGSNDLREIDIHPLVFNARQRCREIANGAKYLLKVDIQLLFIDACQDGCDVNIDDRRARGSGDRYRVDSVENFIKACRH
mmetsp:Transcript_44450/g.103864  ORF Transcript_44450/g.103864 Transcript_44450/m.103864 type:complete len:202 (+) Transcript_44450:333-938(+)